MATIEFNTYTTPALGPERLKSLVKSFNEVFEKEMPVSLFAQQYNVTVKGYSFHSVMEHEGEIVGACSAVPYEYSYFGEKRIFGLLVGLFVLKKFRKDPFALYKMYKDLKVMMINDGLSFSMAVPNNNSYPYLTQVLKWKDIGNLPYYALPVRLGNIRKGSRILNLLSRSFTGTLTAAAVSGNLFYNHSQKTSLIHLLRSEPLMEDHRYTTEHKKINNKYFSAFYRVIREEGINTAYIIDFYNNDRRRDSRSLRSAVSFILKNESPDIVLFIGRLRFNQFSLIKVPKNKEPRKLHFCGEILIKNAVKEDIFEYENWDFGLYNFDVR